MYYFEAEIRLCHMKTFLKIAGIALCIIVLWFVIASILPVSYDKCMSTVFENSEILYKTDNIEFDNDSGQLITSVTDDKLYYNITLINKTDGWLNNQNQISSSDTFDKNAVSEALSSLSISTFPELMNNDNTEGCYYGIVPTDCDSLLFNGIKAELIPQTVEINGEKFDFYFYYLTTDNVEQASVYYVDNKGNQKQITEEVY